MIKTLDIKTTRVTVTYTDYRSADEIVADLTKGGGNIHVEFPETVTVRETKIVKISREDTRIARRMLATR